MSILVDENTKILVQGITGSFGGRHAQLSLDYGTQLVAGVTPGKGGQLFADRVPIFDTCEDRHRTRRPLAPDAMHDVPVCSSCRACVQT